MNWIHKVICLYVMTIEYLHILGAPVGNLQDGCTIEGDTKKGHTHFGPLFLILDQSFTLNGQNNLLRALD